LKIVKWIFAVVAVTAISVDIVDGCLIAFYVVDEDTVGQVDSAFFVFINVVVGTIYIIGGVRVLRYLQSPQAAQNPLLKRKFSSTTPNIVITGAGMLLFTIVVSLTFLDIQQAPTGYITWWFMLFLIVMVISFAHVFYFAAPRLCRFCSSYDSDKLSSLITAAKLSTITTSGDHLIQTIESADKEQECRRTTSTTSKEINPNNVSDIASDIQDLTMLADINTRDSSELRSGSRRSSGSDERKPTPNKQIRPINAFVVQVPVSPVQIDSLESDSDSDSGSERSESSFDEVIPIDAQSLKTETVSSTRTDEDIIRNNRVVTTNLT